MNPTLIQVCIVKLCITITRDLSGSNKISIQLIVAARCHAESFAMPFSCLPTFGNSYELKLAISAGCAVADIAFCFLQL